MKRANRNFPSRAFVYYAWITTAAMFLVLLMGFTVTTTGSGQGCGHSWPLCHGQFIPAYTIASLIEYSHRAVTGVAGFLVFILLLWSLRGIRRPDVLLPASVGMLFVLVQAGIGAADVIWPESAEVLALHFGFSLLAFAGVLLTAISLTQLHAGKGMTVRSQRAPGHASWWYWGLFAYTYGTVYLGAYVTHRKAGLACGGWPLCQGSWFPGFSGQAGIAFAHRLATVGLLAYAVWILLQTWRFRHARRDLFRAAATLLVLVVLQAASGAFMVFSAISVFASLVHVALMTLLFGALSYLCFASFPEPRSARADDLGESLGEKAALQP
ncbi:MAG: heme A synthase [Firmicutes bacterium]|nr:heme A synthase [Bacillota bacterium]